MRLPLDLHRAQAGSALTESLLVVGVLLPFGFAVLTLGKLIDLRQTALQASRYGAWQSTVNRHVSMDPFHQQTLNQRFFTGSTLALSSEDNAAAQSDESIRPNRLWYQHNPVAQSYGNGRLPEVKRDDVRIDPNGVTSTYQNDQALQGAAQGVGKLVAKAGALLDSVAGNEWGLTSSGSVSSSVNVPLLPNQWLGQSAGDCAAVACVQTHSVILSDGWSSSNDDQARRRVRSLVPASAMEPVGNLLAIAGGSLVFPEMKGLKGAFGHVDTSVLPEYVQP